MSLIGILRRREDSGMWGRLPVDEKTMGMVKGFNTIVITNPFDAGNGKSAGDGE